MLARTLLIVALVAAIQPVGTSAQEPLRLDWTAVDRLRDRDGDGIVEGDLKPADAVSSDTVVRVRVAGAGKCDGSVLWEVDGREVDAARRGCVFEVPVAEGSHELLLEVDGEEARLQLEARDHLVVSIGDSVASGEGNPDIGGLEDPHWRERRCHRSMRSGAAQAAVALDRGNPEASVSFVALGCSGATVTTGLLDEYEGVDPDPDLGLLRAQVAEVAELAKRRDIDAVLLSVGANDIHFGSLTIFCAKVHDCKNKPFDPGNPLAESKTSEKTAAQVVDHALKRLRLRYETLATELAKHVPANRVVAVEYFDPLRDAGGKPCRAALPGIDSDEAAWAQTHVLTPLNDELRRVATNHEWRLVTGVTNVFRDHGICAEGPAAWVRRLPESLVQQQDLKGTLHPNGRGHLATAALIAPVLAGTLGEDVGTGLGHLAGEPDREDAGKVHWAFLLLAAGAGALAMWVGSRLGRGFGWVGPALEAAWPVLRVLLVLAIPAALVAIGVLFTWWPLVVVVGAGTLVAAAVLLSALGWITLGLAVAFAAAAFFFEPNAVRVVTGLAAIAAAIAYTIDRFGATEPAQAPALPIRIVRLAGFVALGLVAFGSAFVGGAVVLGIVLEKRIDPIPPFWLQLGATLFVVALLGLLIAFWRSFFRVVWRRTPRLSVSLGFRETPPRRQLPAITISVLLAVLVAVPVLFALNRRPTPREAKDPDVARAAIEGHHDLLLVIDPADRLGRRLIDVARRYRSQGRLGQLFKPAVDDGNDVAFGLAVPQQPGSTHRLWRLVEPPTRDLRELGESLAQIRDTEGPPATGSYGRLLADSRTKVNWREHSRLGVVFLLDRLPAPEELGGAPVDAETSCRELMDGRQLLALPSRLTVPIDWEEALGYLCDPKSGRAVTVHAITGETDAQRVGPWRTWTKALGGRLEGVELGRVNPEDAEWALREARDAHTGKPIGGLVATARTYRPWVKFDSGDALRPIDVDWLFANPPENQPHQVCERDATVDECRDLQRTDDLATGTPEYIAFGGGARHGIDLAVERGAIGRMYVHVRTTRSRVHLGYWWFLPFNSSPWRSDLNCLPGFTVADLSCFDHEGDWEGVTVELSIQDRERLPDPYVPENLEVESVVYDAHGHSVRWGEERLEWVGTRPVVYVAAGSHASYPRPCRRSECTQKLAGKGLGEGRFNGDGEWRFNEDSTCFKDQVDAAGTNWGPCLVALPTTLDGKGGTLWNAYTGRWGAASCSWVGKVCYQTDGPRSPSDQKRFKEPWKPKQRRG